jgi:hypothetical protein
LKCVSIKDKANARKAQVHSRTRAYAAYLRQIAKRRAIAHYLVNKMRNIFAFFSLLLVCCYSIQIKHTDVDTSLLFQQDDNGRMWLSSLNSAQQIKITKFEYEGDTLIVTYRRCAFCSSNNVLPLKDDTKYLKCASELYTVEKMEKGFQIVKVSEVP